MLTFKANLGLRPGFFSVVKRSGFLLKPPGAAGSSGKNRPAGRPFYLSKLPAQG